MKARPLLGALFLEQRMMSPEQLAKIAYSAYGATTDYRNFRGEPMPPYDALPIQIQQAWMNAANAAAMAAVTSATTDVPSPAVKAVLGENATRECRHCGFLWPPGVLLSPGRCPGCQQAYDG